MSQNPSIENGAVWELAVGSSDNNSEVRSQEGSFKGISKVAWKFEESACTFWEPRILWFISFTTGSSVWFLTQFLKTPM